MFRPTRQTLKCTIMVAAKYIYSLVGRIYVTPLLRIWSCEKCIGWPTSPSNHCPQSFTVMGRPPTLALLSGEVNCDCSTLSSVWVLTAPLFRTLDVGKVGVLLKLISRPRSGDGGINSTPQICFHITPQHSDLR